MRVRKDGIILLKTVKQSDYGCYREGAVRTRKDLKSYANIDNYILATRFKEGRNLKG